MKFTFVTGIMYIISGTAFALPMPLPIPNGGLIFDCVVPLADRTTTCCGSGCFPGMFAGFKREQSNVTAVAI